MDLGAKDFIDGGYMNVLVIDYKSFDIEDIYEIFESKKYHIYKYTHNDIGEHRNTSIEQEISDILDKEKIDFIFSFNYYPIISTIVKDMNVKYISYVYDCPHIALYTYTIIYPCNYIFIFDYAMYEELKSGGINTVYYLPLSVNTERTMNTIGNIPQNNTKFDDDVSFVGSLYNESHNLYDRLMDKLGDDEYTKGYLDSLIESQSNIYGYFYLEKMITKELLDKLMTAYPYNPGNDTIATSAYVYAHYFLARKCTEIERTKLLKIVSDNFNTSLYTKNPTPHLPNIKNKGSIDYYNMMPIVFNRSKINLNISLKSITTGIPLRAMDIMGCKDFLLTNYQSDMERHFVAGRDYDYFTSAEDLVQKIDYYLSHEDKRKEIALNGFNIVNENFTTTKAIDYILEVAGII